jgi:diguanylate cyclase (GGDEF)-like protein
MTFPEEAAVFLDFRTILAVGVVIAVGLGVLLLSVWTRDRSVRAFAWWGAAYLIGGSAVSIWMTRSDYLEPLFVHAPAVLIFTGCGVAWNGARVFRGREFSPIGLCAGTLSWSVVCGIWETESPAILMGFGCLIVSIYIFLTALEFRRDRRKKKVCYRLHIVPLLHGAVFLLPTILVFSAPTFSYSNTWFCAFALQALLYAVAAAFFVVVLIKDHALDQQRAAALTDALTGLLNRRGFQEAGDRLIANAAHKHESVSFLAFDLDHFKGINDRFGHAAGDLALRLFASVAQANVRSTDVIARLGGEEFVAVLPNDIADALIVAERIRTAFAAAGVDVGGHRMDATVSIGAAAAPAGEASIRSLTESADGALYCAKRKGRNRVEVAPATAVPLQAPHAASDPILSAA